jgi:preprotein translocase subunit YajC
MSIFSFMLEEAAPTGGGSGSTWISIGMIALLFGFLYFFMIRPQKKQEKKDAAMRDALQVGDEVTTIGGIIGKVVSIKGETFVLETTKDKTKIRFLRGAIRSVDVKSADIAAQVIESNKEAEAAPNDKAEEKPEENK